ncbi:MAG: 30S ribosomal protein THX [Ignavibacteriales bacterium]|jgi:ribosomal small subunit protein bTHX|nr:30S ribosomal protein THX [Ignavibacteriales bacterium]
MGRGDRRSKRGKRWRKSYGKTRLTSRRLRKKKEQSGK